MPPRINAAMPLSQLVAVISIIIQIYKSAINTMYMAILYPIKKTEKLFR